MVRIRLRRVGAKKQPSYRVVAADKESPRDGRFIENLGFYNPRTEPATIQLQEDRIYTWLGNGAQMSDSAEKVLQIAGLLKRYERYKAGESLEVLLEEARAAEAERNIDPKTKWQAPEKSSKKGKKKPESEPSPEAEVKPVSETKAVMEAVEEEPLEIEEPAPVEDVETPDAVKEPEVEVSDEDEEISDEVLMEVVEEQDETEEESSDPEPQEEQDDSGETVEEEADLEIEESEPDEA